MESFEKRATQWEGLWWKHKAGIYTSCTFKMSDLKKFKGKVSFLVRKNPCYKAGTNRPNMQFKICDCNYETEQSFKFQKAVSDKFMEESFIRIEDAIDVARKMLHDMQYGYSYDDLSVEVVGAMEEYIVTPEEIMDEVLDVFEEFEEDDE